MALLEQDRKIINTLYTHHLYENNPPLAKGSIEVILERSRPEKNVSEIPEEDKVIYGRLYFMASCVNENKQDLQKAIDFGNPRACYINQCNQVYKPGLILTKQAAEDGCFSALEEIWQHYNKPPSQSLRDFIFSFSTPSSEPDPKYQGERIKYGKMFLEHPLCKKEKEADIKAVLEKEGVNLEALQGNAASSSQETHKKTEEPKRKMLILTKTAVNLEEPGNAASSPQETHKKTEEPEQPKKLKRRGTLGGVRIYSDNQQPVSLLNEVEVSSPDLLQLKLG